MFNGKKEKQDLVLEAEPRSLESIVYYLGQIVRQKYFLSAAEKTNLDEVRFRAESPEGAFRDESLFDVESYQGPLPPASALAALHPPEPQPLRLLTSRWRRCFRPKRRRIFGPGGMRSK